MLILFFHYFYIQYKTKSNKTKDSNEEKKGNGKGCNAFINENIKVLSVLYTLMELLRIHK